MWPAVMNSRNLERLFLGGIAVIVLTPLSALLRLPPTVILGAIGVGLVCAAIGLVKSLVG